MSSNQQPEHLSRPHYDRLAVALRDAQLVLLDARMQVQDQVVVPVAEVDFLLRRAEQLVQACRDSLPPAERVIPR